MKHVFIVLTLSFLSSLSFAQEAYKIGVASWSGYPDSIRGFKVGLEKSGIASTDYELLVGQTGADKELQKRVAHEFVSKSVDLVYSLTTSGTSVMKDIIPDTTPIVFSIVTYPADSGLIESFEYSGNNLVGTSNYVSIKHYYTLLKLILPDVRSVAIFHRKGEPNSRIQAVSMVRILKKNGIKARIVQSETIEALKEQASALVGQVDVYMTTTDTLMQSGGERALSEISLAHKIPILSSNKQGISDGSTFGPVTDFYTLGVMAGEMASKILVQGVAPTDMESKVQDPPLFLVNRSSMKQLGLSLSERAKASINWVDE